MHPLPEGIKNGDKNEEEKEESKMNKENDGKEVAMDVSQTKEQKGSERKMSNPGVSKRNLWKKTRTNAAKLVQLELLKRAKKTKRKKLQFQTRFLFMSFIRMCLICLHIAREKHSMDRYSHVEVKLRSNMSMVVTH